MSTPARRPETPDVVVGNYVHKYTSSNPAIRLLTNRFLGRLDRVLEAVHREAPDAAVLEVGCGEGEICRRLRGRWAEVVGLDLPDQGLRSEWAKVPGPSFLHGDAHRLPFPDDAFDVVVAVEVLEHLRDPSAGLAEIVRVARRDLVLSVPREPIFRLGNLVSGRHVRALGNTPGHLNHWSTVSFVRFVSQVAAVRDVAKPLPWTIVWARLG
jgi:ubiquinone/menaquinone biosynthesis C-methylase UbiE